MHVLMEGVFVRKKGFRSNLMFIFPLNCITCKIENTNGCD